MESGKRIVREVVNMTYGHVKNVARYSIDDQTKLAVVAHPVWDRMVTMEQVAGRINRQ